jgi:hypothetical protein
MPPAVASVAQVCRRCHVMNGQLFDGSRHKVAFEQHKWPECGQCHGKHNVAKVSDKLIGNTPGTLCHDCHSQHSKENPQCDATAASFRTTLDELSAGRAEVAPQEERLAERGLDAEPVARAVSELDEALVQTRTRVHSFDLGTFQQAATPAREALAKARASTAAADADFRFRQKGLVAALASIGILALAMALKLRDAERKR